MKTFAALLLAATAIASPIQKRLNDKDFQIVNLARNLESLELNYWNQGLDNYTDADFSDAGYPGFRTFLSLFRDQEIAHFTALNNALGGGFENCTYTFPVDSVTKFIQLGSIITTVGEGAFIGAAANLTDSASRLLGATIQGNEARQNSYLRQTLGAFFFEAVNFDTPLTASQAYSLAKPFLNCPSSNPKITFHSIPPLVAMFTNNGTMNMAGDEIMITWDANTVVLGDDVHITFLNDQHAIPCPLTQTGAGMGTTSLPQGINGTAILSATNFQGGGPIPDLQNFAIGALIVN